MAVDFLQHRLTLHLPVTCVKPISGKVNEMSGPLPDAGREKFKVVKHRIAKTHQMRNRMEVTALIGEISNSEWRQYVSV